MLAVDWYSADWNRRPPGMPWDDWVVWQAWLQTPAARRWQYAYDVELWTQALPPGSASQELLRMWARNTARRIDVVAWDGERHHIIETRRRAGWSALGQLTGYQMWWRIIFPNEPLGQAILMSEEIPDDIRAAARVRRIKTWIIGEPAP